MISNRSWSRTVWAVFFTLGLSFSAQAEELRLPLFRGGWFDLAQSRGPVTVVNFWASWCPSCRAETPILNAFYRRHQKHGLRMIGVSVDRKEDREKAAAMAAHFAFPSGLGADASANSFGSPRRMPTTYILNASGTITSEFSGGDNGVSLEELESAVLPLLQ